MDLWCRAGAGRVTAGRAGPDIEGRGARGREGAARSGGRLFADGGGTRDHTKAGADADVRGAAVGGHIMTAKVRVWLAERPDPLLARAIDRLARTEDVAHIAVMPDAHVSEDVCVGTVTATTRRLLPAAVGGDIGCGMTAVRLGARAESLADRHRAARVLSAFSRLLPGLARPAAEAPPLPDALLGRPLSAPS